MPLLTFDFTLKLPVSPSPWLSLHSPAMRRNEARIFEPPKGIRSVRATWLALTAEIV